jgi:hypothetical protein
MIKKLSMKFGSKTKAQEMVLLLNDAKEVVRQGFYDEELLAVERFCQEHDLFLIKSKFKVLLAGEASYSNKGIRIKETDKRPGMFFVYLSKDEQKAWLAAYYELVGNEHDLGILLGYPKCCVKFFLKNFNQKTPNPVHLPTNLFTNISKRDQDLVIISHFPCHSDCEPSMELGKKYLDLLRNVDMIRTKELVENLKRD